ncbi:MAG: hypothetical protein PUC47_01210 [Oscillospiraceae bacterium]|nr:hypothetical protein [Oscillospiraceae bacterium]
MKASLLQPLGAVLFRFYALFFSLFTTKSSQNAADSQNIYLSAFVFLQPIAFFFKNAYNTFVGHDRTDLCRTGPDRSIFAALPRIIKGGAQWKNSSS